MLVKAPRRRPSSAADVLPMSSLVALNFNVACGSCACVGFFSVEFFSPFPDPLPDPETVPDPRPRTTLANHSQTLERPSSLQRILTPRKERIHPTTARINHPPHLMTHGYLVPRKPFLLGEIFHGPPSPQ